MESKRQERIQKLLQQELSVIFQRELGTITQKAMVSVTKVYVTPDLGQAKVYLSLFATSDKESLMEDIVKHTSVIRGKLGTKIRHQLRVIPELQFYEDDSLDYIDRIDTLLNE